MGADVVSVNYRKAYFSQFITFFTVKGSAIKFKYKVTGNQI